MAGVPAHWRTSTSDADPNPEFLDIWLNEFDALSPWTIGRYGNEEDADRFAEEKIKGDIELIQRRNEEGGHRHIDYIPVVLPGGSVSFHIVGCCSSHAEYISLGIQHLARTMGLQRYQAERRSFPVETNI